MTVYITNITFNYDSGLEEGMQGVSLSFTTVGGTYSISGKLNIDKTEYLDNQDINELRELVKQRIVTDLS